MQNWRMKSMLESLREELYQLHLELPKNNLVTWTSGNISARDPETGYVVIKPSGIRYDALHPSQMVILDLEGKLIEGDLKPSSDVDSHLYIYRCRPDVNGVEHTHSPYATAFAAVNQAIMTEDAARTVWLALQIGKPDVIPDEDVKKLHNRYTHVYGQQD